MQITITKEFSFEAAHKLNWHNGHCANLHGHSYKLFVSAKGELNENGLLMDFGDLKTLVNELIIKKYDHSFLNDYFTDPTAENMCLSFLAVLNEKDKRIFKVRLYETATSFAEAELQ